VTGLAALVIAAAAALAAYTYVGYPLALLVLGALRRGAGAGTKPAEWPGVSVVVPAYNEERSVGATLERILALDYPSDRLQVVVVSDASTDRTDEIVRGFASRGVELLRLERRGGKTAAENAARSRLRGEIVVNTDASVILPPTSLKPLVAAFADPSVGVASGRDLSVKQADTSGANVGESGYVGYEMWVRRLETRVHGIVGASGCFYAARAALHSREVPAELSRDFAAALVARDHGLRAVSVEEAVCYVPRTASLRAEYRRKVRTMARGMGTLGAWRHLLNPLRHGVFAWMLWSHKVCRWLLPWAAAAALLALLVVAPRSAMAGALSFLGLAAISLAMVGWLWPEGRPMPRLLAVPSYAVSGNLAAIHAAIRALRRERQPIWEPTRREAVGAR
jgi:cellulose synthase/poly-beta-1,6-N-acetylglucosamine synthase-like glycosyltransferase